MKVNAINKDEYSDFYQAYIDLIPQDKNLGDLFQQNKEDLLDVLGKIKQENLQYAYAEDKWSIADVIQHILDVERIFQYRALCIARRDKTNFPGFDHDNYVSVSESDKRSLDDFKKEFQTIRNSSIALYRSFSEVMLKQKGEMNNSPVTARALGFLMVGHIMHHLRILKEKYLKR